MVEQLNLVDHDDKVAKAAFRLLLNKAAPMPMGTLAERIGVEQALVDNCLITCGSRDGQRQTGIGC